MMATNPYTLGEWVRARREALGLSQKDLAGSSCVSRSYMCDIERGRGQRPSIDVLDRIAHALGAPRRDIIAAAGFIPRASASQPTEAQSVVVAIMQTLADNEQMQVVRFAQFIGQQARMVTHDQDCRPDRARGG